MIIEEARIQAVVRRHCWIGEEPMWWAERGCMIQTDEASALLVNIEDGSYCEWALERAGAAFGLTQSGRLFQASGRQIGFVNEDGTIAPMHGAAPLRARIFNDGKTGPDGRFYAGTIYGENEDGALYSLDRFGKITLCHRGLKLSNGLDWSPDGRYLYLVDSGTKEILRFPFDKRAGIGDFCEHFMRIPDGLGGPDGLCCDEEGFLWCALWGEGYVARIHPQTADIERLVHLPARAVASCAFVGEGLDHLAVTTASYPARDVHSGEDGYTYIIDVGKRGLPVYRFPD